MPFKENTLKCLNNVFQVTVPQKKYSGCNFYDRVVGAQDIRIIQGTIPKLASLANPFSMEKLLNTDYRVLNPQATASSANGRAR